jgi:hypothetical protein
MRWYSLISTSSPELEDVSVRIVREFKARRETIRGHRPARSWYYNKSSAYDIHVSDLLDRNGEIRWIEVILILLIQMPAIGESKTEPSFRINLETAHDVNRVVFKRIWCSPGHICN